MSAETKKYVINEIFLSLQGEGARVGTVNVFIRFSGCNMDCRRDHESENARFDCDTEFLSGRRLTRAEIIEEVKAKAGDCHWVILTGGEPALQVDEDLVRSLQGAGFRIAIETNGTKELPEGIDYVCVSPKTAEHTLRVKRADEVKYVRHAGQAIPRPSIEATHFFISPAWDSHGPNRDNIGCCIQLCLENPQWRLSLQTHKLLAIR